MQDIAQGAPVSPSAQAVQDIAARTSMAPTPDYLGGTQFSSQAMPMQDVAAAAGAPGGASAVNVPPADKSFFEKTVDFFSPKAREAAGTENAILKTMEQTGLSREAVMNAPKDSNVGMLLSKNMPGMISTYGPLALAGVGTLAAMGGLSPQPAEMPEMFKGPTGSELLERYPERYGLAFGGSRVVRAPQYRMPGYADGGIATLAGGGTAKFPRKNGHISGPGGPKDDKIPAMLSDGEFVFTAKAVRNMGNGSRRKGAKKMYALMKALEGRAA